MARLGFTKAVGLGMLLSLLANVHGCNNDDPVQSITVSLRNTESYEYPTVGGDEEGARIVTQARHSSISEIRRDAATNWIATYVYQPLAGFAGSDYAAIEILTGSDGAGPPTNIKRVAFHFRVSH